MIVEDNILMRRTLKSFVGLAGNEFVECDDGSMALSLFEQARPDWVLMDIQLKAVDGITATRQIIKVYPDAKIIMVTNFHESAFRHAAKVAGAIGYVAKDNLSKLPLFLSGNISS